MTSVAIIKESKEQASVLKNFVNRTHGFYVAHVYHSCNDALKGLLLHPVDIAIIDMQLNDCGEIELIAKLKSKTIYTKYLVFTIHNDDKTIFKAFRAGADGYILKHDNFEKIKNALQELANGGAPLSSYIASTLIKYFHPKKLFNQQFPLSDREKEILQFVSHGLLYKEIALKMGIQYETVKKHLSNIYSKLEVQNKVEALNKVYGF